LQTEKYTTLNLCIWFDDLGLNIDKYKRKVSTEHIKI